MVTRPGVGGTTVVCRLACTRCPTVGEVNFHRLPAPDQIDQKFTQRGWQARKRLCPDCFAKSKEKPMATKPSLSAMKAQGQMFELLSTHFDKDGGAYETGWSDAKVATDTGLAPELVTEFRRTCFGELKEPEDVRALRDDINALDRMINDNQASLASEIAGLRGKLAKLSARWAA